MNYLEEWNNIEGMIENHDTSKATVITSEKRQALALSHIAKCLSVFADDITDAHANVDSIRRCGECIHQGNIEHCASCQIIFNATGFEKKTTDNICCETCLHGDKDIHQDPCLSCDGYGGYWDPKKATDAKPCNNCIHSNDEYELNCSVCDESHNEYKPFGFRSKKEKIEIACPLCSKVITVEIKDKDILTLRCPSCGTNITYYVKDARYKVWID